MACLFCRIAAGEIPAEVVFRDGDAVAFLDISPLSRGHTLLIPKAHRTRLEDLSAGEAAAFFAAFHRLHGAVLKAAGATASTIGINNGPDAGQEVPHLHLHIVPRTPGDGGGPIHAVMRTRPAVTKEEIREIGERIRQGVEPAAGRPKK